MKPKRFWAEVDISDFEVEAPHHLRWCRDELRRIFNEEVVKKGHAAIWPSVVVSERWTEMGVKLRLVALAYTKDAA